MSRHSKRKKRRDEIKNREQFLKVLKSKYRLHCDAYNIQFVHVFHEDEDIKLKELRPINETIDDMLDLPLNVLKNVFRETWSLVMVMKGIHRYNSVEEEFRIHIAREIFSDLVIINAEQYCNWANDQLISKPPSSGFSEISQILTMSLACEDDKYERSVFTGDQKTLAHQLGQKIYEQSESPEQGIENLKLAFHLCPIADKHTLDVSFKGIGNWQLSVLGLAYIDELEEDELEEDE